MTPTIGTLLLICGAIALGTALIKIAWRVLNFVLGCIWKLIFAMIVIIVIPGLVVAMGYLLFMVIKFIVAIPL